MIVVISKKESVYHYFQGICGHTAQKLQSPV